MCDVDTCEAHYVSSKIIALWSKKVSEISEYSDLCSFISVELLRAVRAVTFVLRILKRMLDEFAQSKSTFLVRETRRRGALTIRNKLLAVSYFICQFY